MRAFTSLAGHILGSHPSINGYYEMHISYDDAAALDRQLEMYQQHEKLKAGSRYLFDKLLHNDYRINTGLFEPADTKILVSLLEPGKTVRSIVDLFRKKPKQALYASPCEAAGYYTDRVSLLAEFCRNADLPFFYYDAQLFQEAPDKLLRTLTDWLDLDSSLTERYQLFSQTGKERTGDSSALIYSGKIDKHQADYSHIDIPEHVQSRACEIYRVCRSAIIDKAADALVASGNRVTL
jgi:hypothetical protein